MKDITTADPATLSDAEHAELSAQWDAALERALATTPLKKWPVVDPAAIIASGKYDDRPALRRELTRSNVQVVNRRQSWTEIEMVES